MKHIAPQTSSPKIRLSSIEAHVLDPKTSSSKSGQANAPKEQDRGAAPFRRPGREVLPDPASDPDDHCDCSCPSDAPLLHVPAPSFSRSHSVARVSRPGSGGAFSR